MKANNTTKRVKTLEEINAQAERLMQANETWYQDATRANREPINRKAQIIAAWHNTKTAAKELQNNTTPSTPDTMNTETKTIVTVSITEDGNKCEYTANGKVLASITYRKEFDKYDVNTPSVGYMTDNVTEAHKACESGINWLLEQGERKAAFNYTFAM